MVALELQLLPRDGLYSATIISFVKFQAFFLSTATTVNSNKELKQG